MQQQQSVVFEEPPEVRISFDRPEMGIQGLREKYAKLSDILSREQAGPSTPPSQKDENFCKNGKINALFKPVLQNTYDVFFDEIFDCLIDEVLQEEVVMLNNLEAFGQEPRETRLSQPEVQSYSEQEMRVLTII